MKHDYPHYVRQWRELKSLKQDALAEKLAVSKSAISKLENYQTKLSLSRGKQIAGILELDFEHLLKDPLSFLPPPPAIWNRLISRKIVGIWQRTV